MKDYCADFRHYLIHVKEVSDNTLDSYLRDIKRFLAFLAETGCADPIDAAVELIQTYTDGLKKSNKSSATILRNVATVRCFYKYLIFSGQASFNPAKSIKLEKPKKRLPQILTGQEIELLLSQPDRTKVKGCRDKAMLELLYATGIRVSELIDLNLDDIDLHTGVLRCCSERSQRLIPVYSTAVAAVSDYVLQVRSQILSSEGGRALFINLNGCRLTRQGFWKIIKTYARQANIVKKITPHTLRHSFALHLLENGAELKDIQAMLGHADISSTQVYVHLLNDHFKEVYRHCHPRAKLG